ncbi:MAG TPA: hypothetical protein VMT85_15945 [Thermoanaerobaculia bacterium]|nr:hypothetical protein [Thermoanaerobaculia bacterium]
MRSKTEPTPTPQDSRTRRHGHVHARAAHPSGHSLRLLAAPRRLALSLLAIVALALAGCMIGVTTHTLYFEPDGSLTWIVEEREMRSAEDERRDRQREEQEWLGERAGETHDAAEALWQIGAASVETTIVRNRRPFHVLTRATFADAGDAIERLFAATGLIGDVEVGRGPRGGAVAITIDVEASERAEQDQAGNERPIDSLLLADDFLVMVADGRFVEAVGFTVDGDLARFDEDAFETALERDPRTLRLYLAWEHGE